MELRPSLDKYDEQSFLRLVEDIWHVQTDKVSHDALINHFNRIVGHPSGSDLLFYPDVSQGNYNSPGEIVAKIKAWYRIKGRTAFKGQTLPPPPVRQSLTREQKASQSSTQNLQKVRKLVAEVQAAEQQVNSKLAALEQQLARSAGAVTGPPVQQLAANHAALRALEMAQQQGRTALGQLERLVLPVKFALDGAKRDATGAFLNAAIQAVVLREITAGSQRHSAALAAARVRHPALYARGVKRIESLEASIAQLAKATATGPGHGPLTLKAAAHAASLHPALLTARGLSREAAQHQHHLIKSVRSAVAELEWQATSLQGDHPGVYSDIVEFVLSTPSDDPRFAMTVPLVELFTSKPMDWFALAQEGGEVDLPMRLCSMVKGTSNGTSTGVKPFTRYSHVVMTPTQGRVPSQVRVRPAVWDATQQAFVFTSEGRAPVTVYWQKGVASYAPNDLSRPPGTSYLNIPSVPLIARFEDLEQLQFDDYIVVFAAGSGLEPLYLMFRDRREL